MRVRSLFSVLAMATLVTLGMAAQVLATTLFYDDFLGTGTPPDGTSLDTTKWTVANSGPNGWWTGTPTVAGSALTLTSNAVSPKNNSEVVSIPTFTSGNTFTFKIGSDFSGTTATVFDLNYGGKGIAVSNEISLSTQWELTTTDNFSTYTRINVPTPQAGDFYDIVWQSTSVELWVNGVKKATSTTNLPTGSPNMNIRMFTYDGGSEGFDSVKVSEGVVISSIPEPSTITLLTIGAIALLAYAWRKQK